MEFYIACRVGVKKDHPPYMIGHLVGDQAGDLQ